MNSKVYYEIGLAFQIMWMRQGAVIPIYSGSSCTQVCQTCI